MITIYGELYSSKNSRNTVNIGGRLIPLKSKKSKEQEGDFQYQFSALRREFQKQTKGKEFPLRLQFKIYRRTDRKFDFTNITQGILDGMVRSGLVPDDDALCPLCFVKRAEKIIGATVWKLEPKE